MFRKLLFAFLVSATCAFAQNSFELTGVKLDMNGSELSNGSIVWFAGYHRAIEPNVAFALEIPFSVAGPEGSESTTAFGNPYVGFVLGSARAPLQIEVGGRVPLAPEANFAAATATLADFPLKAEAFIQNYAPIEAKTSYIHKMATVEARLLLGATTLIATKGGGTIEAHIPFSVGFWDNLGNLSGGVAIEGRYVGATEKSLSLSEAMYTQLSVNGEFRISKVVAALGLKVPLSETLDVLSKSLYGGVKIEL